MLSRLIIKALLLASLISLPPQSVAASGCLCVKCLFGTHSSFVAAAGSMLPAIAVGQCLVVRVVEPGSFDPRPGDIVAMERGSGGPVYVKRVVAVGGQRVQMVEGRLHLDGRQVETQPLPDYVLPDYVLPDDQALAARDCPGTRTSAGLCAVRQLRETLPNGASYPVLDMRDGSFTDSGKAETVPEGHVYLLGDNRDNSLDSRIGRESGGFGMVPLGDILGPVTNIGP